MFRYVLFSLWLTGSASSAFATPQAPDYLIVKVDTFKLFTKPLEALPARARYIRTIFPFDNTSCWCGYVGYWTLSDQKLYLTGIISCSFDRKDTVSLATVFGDQYKDGKVAAEWFSGELLCVYGKLIRYFGDEPIYSFKLVYQCSRGRITGE
jgi:hypothetical protein